MSPEKGNLGRNYLKEQQDEMEKKPEGFLRSYKDFLDKWGTYQKSKGTGTKPKERLKRPAFRATFYRSE